VAANSRLIAAPSESPKNAARREPTASITARTSSIRVSSVGAPVTGSDIPVPRLSKRIRRENAPSSSGSFEKPGSFHCSSRWVTNPGTKTRSNGPSPHTW
jgi:hypothetical protein